VNVAQFLSVLVVIIQQKCLIFNNAFGLFAENGRVNGVSGLLIVPLNRICGLEVFCFTAEPQLAVQDSASLLNDIEA
jgi:hypothetical protein